MQSSSVLRWRKTTDINRENPLFELLNGEVLLLDVGFNDAGDFEISFNPGVVGKLFEWQQFIKLLEEGKALADRDFSGSADFEKID